MSVVFRSALTTARIKFIRFTSCGSLVTFDSLSCRSILPPQPLRHQRHQRHQRLAALQVAPDPCFARTMDPRRASMVSTVKTTIQHLRKHRGVRQGRRV